MSSAAQPASKTDRPFSRWKNYLDQKAAFVSTASVQIEGDCFEAMEGAARDADLAGSVDCVFADPPYFLSNDGVTCQNGRMVSVNKGRWDTSKGALENHAFNRRWLELCQRLLKPDGTLWVSGTHHVIYSVGFALQELGFKLLNTIVWEKPNPPPNLSCRYFTHSTELIIWAARDASSKHTFNYAEMKAANEDRQMKDVWRLTAPGRAEKAFGKHPTQKPLALVERCLEASTRPGDLVLDPFSGSGTTLIAAQKLGRFAIGIEGDSQHVELATRRIQSLET
ncbi:MAG: DNA-methyltransferase [Opitutales bacterium]